MQAPDTRRARREVLIALLSYALVVAPFGCQFQTQLLTPPEDAEAALDFESVGMFINEDVTSELMVAGRDADGAAFYVYGTRLADGGIGEVRSVLVRSAAGEESFIAFEQGRPVHVQGPDESYLHIDYSDVAPLRLAAEVTLFDAGSGARTVQTVAIDLTEPVERSAAALEALTGQQVAAPTAKGVQVMRAKDEARSLGPIVTMLAALAVVALGSVTVLILGQVADNLADIVGAAFTATMLIVLSPVILLTELIDGLRGRAQAAPLIEIFIELPARPQVAVEFG